MPESGSPIYFELAAGGHSRIALFDANKSAKPAFLPIAAANPREPAVSHDGKIVAAVCGKFLCLFDGVSTHTFPALAPVCDPSFAPDDRSILFASNSRIMRFDPATNRAVTLLESRGRVARPSISLDGRSLAFASEQGGAWQIWSADLEDLQPHKLTAGNCNNTDPAWSPSSDEIVFASDCGRGLGLPALVHIAARQHLADFRPEKPELKALPPLFTAGNR